MYLLLLVNYKTKVSIHFTRWSLKKCFFHLLTRKSKLKILYLLTLICFLHVPKVLVSLTMFHIPPPTQISTKFFQACFISNPFPPPCFLPHHFFSALKKFLQHVPHLTVTSSFSFPPSLFPSLFPLPFPLPSFPSLFPSLFSLPFPLPFFPLLSSPSLFPSTYCLSLGGGVGVRGPTPDSVGLTALPYMNSIRFQIWVEEEGWEGGRRGGGEGWGGVGWLCKKESV